MVIGGFARSLINFRGPLLQAMVKQGHEVLACAPDADAVIREKLAEIGARYFHLPLARTPAGNLKTLAG